MLQGPGISRLAASARWQAMLGRFDRASLADAQECSLANRTDTKFVLAADVLRTILDELDADYRVLDVDGSCFTTYRTQYFDTASYELFRRHHAGGRDRYKVRTRTYLNTGLAFVEVKRRTRTGATSKSRMQTPQFEMELGEDACAFVDAHCPYAASTLFPALLNSFDRICLIDTERRERLTVDLDLAVETPAGPLPMTEIAVAELKRERQPGGRRASAFLRAMHAHHQRPTGFSKYCMGLLLAKPEIKHNLFLPQLKQLRRVMGESHVVR